MCLLPFKSDSAILGSTQHVASIEQVVDHIMRVLEPINFEKFLPLRQKAMGGAASRFDIGTESGPWDRFSIRGPRRTASKFRQTRP